MGGCTAICIISMPESGDTFIFKCGGWSISGNMNQSLEFEVKSKSVDSQKYINTKNLSEAVAVAKQILNAEEKPDPPRRRRRRD